MCGGSRPSDLPAALDQGFGGATGFRGRYSTVQSSLVRVFWANPGVLCKVLDGEQILVHLDTGFYFALQGVGVRAWELLENRATADSLVDTLGSEYEVDRGQLARDVDTLLNELKQHDLVVEDP